MKDSIIILMCVHILILWLMDFMGWHIFGLEASIVIFNSLLLYWRGKI